MPLAFMWLRSASMRVVIAVFMGVISYFWIYFVGLFTGVNMQIYRKIRLRRFSPDKKMPGII